MATVNILSWNIGTFGPKRYINRGIRSPGATPLFQILVDTVTTYDVTIFAVIDFDPSIAQMAATELKNWLNSGAAIAAGRQAANTPGAVATATAAARTAGVLAAATPISNLLVTTALKQFRTGALLVNAVGTVAGVIPGVTANFAQTVARQAVNDIYSGVLPAQASSNTAVALIAALAAEAALAGANIIPTVTRVGASVHVATITATAAQRAAAMPGANFNSVLAATLPITKTAVIVEATAAADSAGPAARNAVADYQPGQLASSAALPGGVAGAAPGVGVITGVITPTVAAVAVPASGAMVSPLVANAASVAATNSVLTAFVVAAGTVGSVWDFELVNAGTESYGVFYRNNAGFNIKRHASPQPGSNTSIVGLDHSVQNGNLLPFPKPLAPTGGRRPAYFTFETTDRVPPVLFTVVTYNATHGSQLGLGVRNAASVDTINQVIENTVAGLVAHQVYASFVTGSFYVDLLSDQQGYYTDLIKLGSQAVTEAMGDAAKSSLGLWVDSNNSVDFRSKAWDNIFLRGPALPNSVTMMNNQIIDMVANFYVGGILAHCPGYCEAAFRPVINAKNIGNNPGQLNPNLVLAWNDISLFPPPAMDEALWAYRWGINGGPSGHLPVYAQFVV